VAHECVHDAGIQSFLSPLIDFPSMNPPSQLPPAPMPQPAPAKGKGWIFWGCGGCLFIVIAGGIAFLAVVFFGAMAMIKSSAPYQDALTAAQNSPEVQEALGTPIAAGFMPTGSVDLKNGTGTAEFVIPISGPKGSGKVHYKAAEADGKWTADEFKAVIDGSGKEIDLSK
jgi:cytochrome oxidase complex assembly protein 1